ncbi:MAG: peroxidase-related enzyme [Phycisphaeraceae bacterium]|nr:peroxidase-related enzyme [Phycisphaerales bacterium]MCB9860259.1 peroxidase-related enzyme [Phycisphaeraceae bacterium]
MAYIDVISESDADGELAHLYARYGNPDGSVDNVLKVHSLNPASLEAHCALYVQSTHKQSPLTRAEREMIGVIVSRTNGCTYCNVHHATGLKRLLPDDRKHVADELRDGRSIDEVEITPRERALLVYAEKLTRSPASVQQSDVDAMRGTGLSDREILDAAQVIGYFSYANRIVLGLGAALEETSIGEWPAESRDV